MNKLLGVRLNESRQEKLSFLYKLYKCKSEKDSERFRDLLDKLYSEKTEQSESSTLSTNQHSELDLLEGWDCVFRVLIYPYNKFSKKKEPKIFCLNPTTREILKTNELFVEVCKKCHDTNGSMKPHELPDPKKSTSKPTSKTTTQMKTCINSDCNNEPLFDAWCQDCYDKHDELQAKGRMKTCPTLGCENEIPVNSSHCTDCFDKIRIKLEAKYSKKEFEHGLPGSPMYSMKIEADNIRRTNEKLKEE